LTDGAWLATVLDASLDAIVGQSADGVITSFNGAAERLYGYASDEAVGQPVSMLGAGAEHVRKDGSALAVVSTTADVHDDYGAILGTVTVIRQPVAVSLEHDLNNLLGIIVNFATFVEEELPEGSQAAEDIQEVLRATRRAAQLTRGLP
jgi:PAS domain-containing protein